MVLLQVKVTALILNRKILVKTFPKIIICLIALCPYLIGQEVESKGRDWIAELKTHRSELIQKGLGDTHPYVVAIDRVLKDAGEADIKQENEKLKSNPPKSLYGLSSKYVSIFIANHPQSTIESEKVSLARFCSALESDSMEKKLAGLHPSPTGILLVLDKNNFAEISNWLLAKFPNCTKYVGPPNELFDSYCLPK